MAILTRNNIKYLVGHCSAARNTKVEDISDIDAMHKAKGWSQVGYHYFICRSGLIQVGRPEWVQGAHVYGYNQESLGFCLGGGLDANGKILEGFENAFTPEQGNSLISLLYSLTRKYPKAEVVGHRDLSPDVNGDGEITREEWLKNCPCFDINEWMNINIR